MAFRFSSLLFVKKGVYLPKREPTSEEGEEEEKKEKVLLADAMRSTILVSGRLNPTWAIKPGAITFHSFEGSLSFAHTLSRDKKMERFFCQQAETTTTTTITVWCVHKILLLHTPFTFVHCCWCRDRIKNAFVCWRILKKPQFYGFKALLLSLSFFLKAPHIPFLLSVGNIENNFSSLLLLLYCVLVNM